MPAPKSATATPSSFSVSFRTASAEASELTTSSSILTPAAATHFDRFVTAVGVREYPKGTRNAPVYASISGDVVWYLREGVMTTPREPNAVCTVNGIT